MADGATREPAAGENKPVKATTRPQRVKHSDLDVARAIVDSASLSQAATKLGMSIGHLSDIACGRKRKRVAVMIREMTEIAMFQATTKIRNLLPLAVMQLAGKMSQGDMVGYLAAKCLLDMGYNLCPETVMRQLMAMQRLDEGGDGPSPSRRIVRFEVVEGGSAEVSAAAE